MSTLPAADVPYPRMRGDRANVSRVDGGRGRAHPHPPLALMPLPLL